MKRKHSIKGKTLFKDVFTRGKRYSGNGLRIIVLGYNKSEAGSAHATPSKPDVRIGISINRAYGCAVERNKSKRILRSICGELMHKMSGGFYIVMQPDTSFKNCDYRMMLESTEKLFRKAGIITE